MVEHKGVEESVEKIMKIFEQKGTLQPAQYNYVMGLVVVRFHVAGFYDTFLR